MIDSVRFNETQRSGIVSSEPIPQALEENILFREIYEAEDVILRARESARASNDTKIIPMTQVIYIGDGGGGRAA